MEIFPAALRAATAFSRSPELREFAAAARNTSRDWASLPCRWSARASSIDGLLVAVNPGNHASSTMTPTQLDRNRPKIGSSRKPTLGSSHYSPAVSRNAEMMKGAVQIYLGADPLDRKST